MPVAALDAGQSPAGTGLGRTPAGGRATKGGEIPAVVTGRDSGCGNCGNRERFRLCLWPRSMPGKVPQVLGLVERLPVAGPPKGERFRLW